MSKSIYRKLWEDTYGPIPKDQDGRSFDIHHINGNHDDNRIENLQCLSIEDHFLIHQQQGDIMACCAIMRRMAQPVEFTDEQKSMLSSEAKVAAKKRVEKGTHNFLGGEIQRAHQNRRKNEGVHNFVNSNPNFKIDNTGNKEVIINCVDINGNKIRLTKSEYLQRPECVTVSSNEGLRRLGKTRKLKTDREKRKPRIPYDEIISLIEEKGYKVLSEETGISVHSLQMRKYNALKILKDKNNHLTSKEK